jgi:predicted RNA-binding protein with PUA-like domain
MSGDGSSILYYHTSSTTLAIISIVLVTSEQSPD